MHINRVVKRKKNNIVAKIFHLKPRFGPLRGVKVLAITSILRGRLVKNLASLVKNLATIAKSVVA